MGHIFHLHEARKYADWCQKPGNARFLHAGSEMCRRMLRPKPQEELLDIGCGACFSLLKLRQAGLMVRGLEASPAIADEMSKLHNLKDTIDVGDACHLPYEDNAFSYACFFNALEYIDHPKEALAEAFRVARQKVFIGFLNRYAINYFLKQPGFNKNARFFSLWDIKYMTRSLLGPVPIQWRALMVTPFGGEVVRSKYLPLGAFMGVCITVNPRFTTSGLHLTKVQKNESTICGQVQFSKPKFEAKVQKNKLQ